MIANVLAMFAAVIRSTEQRFAETLSHFGILALSVVVQFSRFFFGMLLRARASTAIDHAFSLLLLVFSCRCFCYIFDFIAEFG